jgi:hypothetical protein
MQPDRYEILSAGRHRLSGFLQKRGSKLGLPTWGGCLFGGLFVAVGMGIVLVGIKAVPVNSASVHAPYWVLTVAGASFALGGFMVWGMTWKQFTAQRLRLAAMRRHPDEPALADYPWHPDGFTVSEWTGAVKSLAGAMGMSVFLSIFNWWAFGLGGPWLLKGIVGLFDIILVLFWGKVFQLLGRALKFGHSRIEFARFPYRLSEPVMLRWQPGGGIRRINQGTFTLRYVEEWMESRGGGENQSNILVHEAIWSAKGIIEQPRNFPLHDAVELRFELPAVALPTRLSADKPLFWELEVKLDLPGLDFNEIYLVPIYGS